MNGNLFELFNIVIGCFIFLSLVYTSIISIKENESTAAGRAFAASILLPIPYLAAAFLSFPFAGTINIILFSVTVLFGILLIIPIRGKKEPKVQPVKKVDERDVMFSRAKLKPGEEKFEEYYQNNPDKKINDDEWRKLPGLMQKGSSVYNPIQFASADASFATISQLHNFCDGESNKEKTETDPVKISNYIKEWGKKLGALEIGITELNENHYYSHKGRGERYGKEVKKNHKYGIALTVEMEKFMMDYAPAGPTVMESAQQYVTSGIIAVQIAAFIRQLGYPALAHIDGNYEVVCPLVARDAGLGEIGRMGLLMTPNEGPRVRLGVITTDIPLVPDKPFDGTAMTDFCRKCKKCADVCPSNSISFDDKEEIDGIKRWQINQETCFKFWCTVGTDCGRCVVTCPFSHPDNFIHNFVRWGIHNSKLFRSFAAKADDWLYGKVPPSKTPDNWLDI